MKNTFLVLLALTITLNFCYFLQAEENSVKKFKHGEYRGSGSVQGGEMADGLDVKNVRWADRGNFERLVFDIYKWGGPTNPSGILPNEYPGTYNFVFKSDTVIEARFDGYRAFTAIFPTFEKSNLVSEIAIIRDEENADDSSFRIKILFKQPVKIEVFELYSPARIVVDLIEKKTE